MAYINQDTKAKIVAVLKPIMAKYGIKATFAVRNHMSFVVNIKAGQIDFIGNHVETVKDNNRYSPENIKWIQDKGAMDINQFWYHEHFTGKALEFFTELFGHIKKGGNWYDNSDIMTDYFDTAFYIDVNVGSWDKPYKVI